MTPNQHPSSDYRTLLENLWMVPWEADASTFCFTYVGPQAEQFLGYPLQEWLKPNFWVDRLHPEDRDAAVCYCLAQTKSRQDHTFEYRMIRADGSIIWVHDRVLVHEEGSRLLLRGILIDITERKQAEILRQKSEKRLEACIRHTPHVGIQWFDQSGRIVLWNQASEKIFGFSETEALGKTLDQLIYTPEEGAEFLKICETIHRTKTPYGPEEISFHRRDGSIGYCLTTIFEIPSMNADPWFACMDVDVTHRKRLEAEMLHTQKMESLGILAGGVAHDFNNLLTSILGYASLIEMETDKHSSIGQSIDQVILAARRAAELTQQLLGYAGKGKFRIEQFRLNDLVSELARLLRPVISDQAKLEIEFEQSNLMYEGDPSQLRQVLMNLITNASDALESQPGTINVRVMQSQINELPNNLVEIPRPFVPGSYLVIEVTDTGRGIPPPMIQRIFDPFFTTKFSGHGLGLAATLGIIRSHQGLIQVLTQPGRGSTFRIYLPAIEATKPANDLLATSSNSASGLILVVDDERLIRSLAVRSLKQLQFQSVEAADGQEGLERFLEQPQAFRAALLDLTMPRRNGIELLKEIRKIRPDLPIVLMSGYSEKTIESDLLQNSHTSFLQKPYTPSKLIEVLRATL